MWPFDAEQRRMDKMVREVFRGKNGVKPVLDETALRWAAEDALRDVQGEMGKQLGAAQRAMFEKSVANYTKEMMEGGLVTRSAKRALKIGKWGFIGALGLAGLGVVAANMRNQKSDIASSASAIPSQDDLNAMQANLDATAAPVVASPQVAAPADTTPERGWVNREATRAAQTAMQGAAVRGA